MPESLAVRRAAESSSLTRVREVLDGFALRDSDGETLTAVRHFPARPAQWAEFPAWVHEDLRAAYQAKNIERLYSHQAAAAEAVHDGRNIVIVTPTASGKTLCYNLPVLNRLLAEPGTRAMYLFPTKALAEDQLKVAIGQINNWENQAPTLGQDAGIFKKPHRADQSGHAAHRHPASPHAMDAAV